MDGQAYLSPREAADLIGIEPLRLIRLGRCLGMASIDRQIPVVLVERVMPEDTPEKRYHALVQLLLGRDCEAGTSQSEATAGTA